MNCAGQSYYSIAMPCLLGWLLLASRLLAPCLLFRCLASY